MGEAAPGAEKLLSPAEGFWQGGRMARNLKFPLFALACLLGPGCASTQGNFGTAEISITVLHGSRPDPHERLVVWIEEHRLELVTDAKGRIDLTEDYPWAGQSFTFPPVGPLRHSPKPTVAVSLASDPGRQFEGVRTAVSEPHDAWKLTIRIDLEQVQ